MICKDSVKKQIGKRFVLKFETLFEYLSPDRKFVSTTVRVDRYPVKIRGCVKTPKKNSQSPDFPKPGLCYVQKFLYL